MKRILTIFLSLMMLPFCVCSYALAGDMTKEELIKELKIMKERIRLLEQRIQQLEGPVGKSVEPTKDLAERVQEIERKIKQGAIPAEWVKRLNFSGTIEVEANYEKMDYDDPGTKDTESGDIVLATAELDVDADIAKHVQGHIAFLWEEDETEPVDIDEGFITIDMGNILPLYVAGGKMYVPFGYYESHFISDPITNTIGETNQSAIKLGFSNDWIEICGAFFNGDVDETGDDDQIDGFAGSIKWSAPEGMFPDLGIVAGLSYISNIGDSDGLEEELPSSIRRHVEGLGAFLSLSLKEKYFVEMEYIGAMDKFGAGELSFDGGKRAKPQAWNVEFAFAPIKKLELALRYEGSNDLGDYEPELQCGLAIIYSLFENTSLSVEYLHGKFENDDKRDLVTGQLAVEF
ncbi:MAG: hypothetical protein DRG63_03340 [Deltaproteobacteria bacterium]|nr:MAG: hypothetical protein DRG63_03340 [Deltaproteobacteria bacterium]